MEAKGFTVYTAILGLITTVLCENIAVFDTIDSSNLPSAPRSFQAEVLDANTVALRWGRPVVEDESASVIGYELTYESSRINEQFKISITPQSINPEAEEFLLNDLTPGTKYWFRLSAKNNYGIGESTPVYLVETPEYIPGPPRRVRLTAVNATAVHVLWKLPREKDKIVKGKIRGYAVYVRKLGNKNSKSLDKMMKMVEVSGTELQTVLTNLEPECLYGVYVTAFTRLGEGEKSRFKKIRTPPKATEKPGPPRKLQGSATTNDFESAYVELTWKSPAKSKPGSVSYILTYYKLSENGSYVPIPTTIAIPSKDETNRYTITEPFLKEETYLFSMFARNSVGTGPAAVTNVTIVSDPPQTRVDIHNVSVNGTTIVLHWNPLPKEAWGGRWLVYEISGEETPPVNTTETSVEFSGLQYSTMYTFRVTPYSAGGMGPYTETKVRTDDELVYPSPSNITLTRLSASSIMVKWSIETQHSVDGYRVYYRAKNETEWQYIDIGPYFLTVISSLVPYEGYSVKMQAVYPTGKGEMSEEVTLQRDTAYPTTKVKGQPYIKTGFPKNVTVKIGEAAVFNCPVEDEFGNTLSVDDGSFSILWSKNALAAEETSETQLPTPHPDPRVFEINAVSSEDAGSYTCVAGNIFGFSFSSAWLNIEPEPLERRKTFVVTTVIEPPFVMVTDTSFEGFLIDLMDEIASLVGVSLSYQLLRPRDPADDVYGTLTENATWSGMIGELITWRADIAAAAMAPTSRNVRVADATLPYMETYLTILVRRPNPRCEPPYLTTTDLLSRNVKLSYIKGTALPVDMMTTDLKEVHSQTDGVSLIKQERYGLILQKHQADFLANKDDSLMTVGKIPGSEKFLSLFTPINSEIFTRLNLAILELREKGTVERLRKKWWSEDEKICTAA